MSTNRPRRRGRGAHARGASSASRRSCASRRSPSPASTRSPCTRWAPRSSTCSRLLASTGVELLDVPDGYPCVYADLPGPEGSPTVLLYAHYDVQPAPESQGWTSAAVRADHEGRRPHLRARRRRRQVGTRHPLRDAQAARPTCPATSRSSSRARRRRSRTSRRSSRPTPSCSRRTPTSSPTSAGRRSAAPVSPPRCAATSRAPSRCGRSRSPCTRACSAARHRCADRDDPHPRHPARRERRHRHPGRRHVAVGRRRHGRGRLPRRLVDPARRRVPRHRLALRPHLGEAVGHRARHGPAEHGRGIQRAAARGHGEAVDAHRARLGRRRPARGADGAPAVAAAVELRGRGRARSRSGMRSRWIESHPAIIAAMDALDEAYGAPVESIGSGASIPLVASLQEGRTGCRDPPVGRGGHREVAHPRLRRVGRPGRDRADDRGADAVHREVRRRASA